MRQNNYRTYIHANLYSPSIQIIEMMQFHWRTTCQKLLSWLTTAGSPIHTILKMYQKLLNISGRLGLSTSYASQATGIIRV